VLYDQIAACRTDPELAERTDVLAMLVRARDESGVPMTDSELRDQLVTLLVAGHETTATGLAWTFERLVRNPAVLARARRAAQDGDDQYLDALVKESLRARPVIMEVGRRLAEPVEIRGYRLPAGTVVLPSIFLVHKSARFHGEPDAFRPERFMEYNVAASGHWMPFGGGVRRCLGATFAQVEMRTVLKAVLSRVELATTTARPERARGRNVTLVPRRGARIRVLDRAPAAPHSPAREPLAPR
jgi:cytochrome P450